VEHVRVDPADGKPVLVDPASALFEKPAGSFRIILCPESVSRDVEYSVLVTEFRIRCRFKCIRVQCTDPLYVPVEKENVAVE
jgi:hypothetical protein